MSSYDKRNRYLLSESFEGLESSFLDEELFLAQGEEEWEPQFGALAAESPFLQLTLPALEQEVHGTDNRRVVENTFKIPNRWICAIDVLTENPKYGTPGEEKHLLSKATGILIGPRHVLTARHIRNTQHYEELFVSPARNGSNSSNPFGKVRAIGFRYPKQRQGHQDDYMLIILEKDLASETHRGMNGALGYWGQNPTQAVIRIMKPDTIRSKKAAVIGYPGDTCGEIKFSGTLEYKMQAIVGCKQNRKDEWASRQWRDTGTLEFLEHSSGIYHTADTFKGQSGSPICLVIDQTLHLVGIHVDQVHGSSRLNQGVSVSKWMLSDLCEWMNADAKYTIATIREGALIVQPRSTDGARARETADDFRDEIQVEDFLFEKIDDSELGDIEFEDDGFYASTEDEMENLTDFDYEENEVDTLRDQRLEERFGPLDVPRAVADALGNKDWSLALRLAIEAGLRDQNELTNLIFFSQHPELPNVRLDPSHPNFGQLSKEWAKIFREQVWKAIQRSAENTTLAVSGKEAAEHHRYFWGTNGKQLKKLVEEAAKEVDINPGLLGTTMIVESVPGPQIFLSSEKVKSYNIGVDDFYEARGAISARVPAYGKIRWDKRQTPEEHPNDAKDNPRIVKTIQFDSGRDAALALAVYVKFYEVRLREKAASLKRDFDTLPLATKMALTRMAMAAGMGGATPRLEEALGGKDIFIRKSIPVKKYQTQRNATVRVAQAMHLSDWVFAVPVPAVAAQPELETSEANLEEAAEEETYEFDFEEQWDGSRSDDDLKSDKWWDGALEEAIVEEPELLWEEETYDSDREFDDTWTRDFTMGTALPAGVSEAESSAAPVHLAFPHILLESRDAATSAMVPGVVPATPSRLNTTFFDATIAGSVPDPSLQQALTSLLNSRSAFINAGRNIAVSLVDLSGANKQSPRYAGFNDLMNFYGASVNKITGLLGVYQLLAEANELLKANPTISDVIGLESEFRARWTGAGIAVQHHPRVTMILTVQPGKPASPATAAIHPELMARLRRISSGNRNGSTPIVLLKYPYLGSTLLAHGLYSSANRSGLWTRSAYGPIYYLRQKLALAAWSAKENPYPKTYVHNINAVSIAQFFTLAAQRRMIGQGTSKAVLQHLQTGACTTLIDTTDLEASGHVSAKCGIYGGWVHNALHFKETATLREFVVVILTKNSTFGIMKNLFKDLMALVP